MTKKELLNHPAFIKASDDCSITISVDKYKFRLSDIRYDVEAKEFHVHGINVPYVKAIKEELTLL